MAATIDEAHFAACPVALAILEGPERRHAAFNPRYQSLAEERGGLAGRPLAEVWPEIGAVLLEACRQVPAEGGPAQATAPALEVRRGGEAAWLTFAFAPLPAGPGEAPRLLVTVVEASAEVRAVQAALRLEARLEEERRRLRVSQALSEALSDARTRGEVARTIFEKGLAVMGASAGALLLFPPGSAGQLEIVEQFGYPEPLIEAWRFVPLSLEAPSTDAVRLGVPVWVGSRAMALDRYPTWAAAVFDGPDHAWAGLPLEVGGRVLGALGLTWYEERTFEEEDQRLLASIAGRCAQALDRAAALDEAERRAAELQAVLEAAPVAIFMARDAAGAKITGNRAGQALIGIPAGGNASLRVPPGETPRYVPLRGEAQLPLDELPMQLAATQGKEVEGLEFDILRGDGERRHVVASARPIVGAGGARQGAVGVFVDVTERTRAEARLRESEAVLRAILDATSESIWLFSVDGVALAANRTALDRWGGPAESVLGRRLLDFLPEALARSRGAALAETARTGRPLVFEDSRAGIHFEHTFFPVAAPDGKIDRVAIFSRDVTERRRAAEALRLSEERLVLALRNAPVSVAAQDRELRYTWAYNQRTVRPEEVVGRSDADLFPPAEAAHLVALKRRVLEEGVELREQLWFDRPGGRMFLDVYFVPLHDAGGRVIGVGTATVDLTPMKLAEEALREADRRKDDFLGLLSHELRNPLGPIRNSLYILEHGEASGEQATRARGVIRRQAEHLARLVDDLLDVTRIAHGRIELRRERTDLRDLVARTAEDFRAVVEARGAALTTSLPAEAPFADVDPVRVSQVLGNLLANAAKFSRGGDRVEVVLRADEGAAELSVRDTGAGIDPELLPGVFAPFVQGARTLARSEGGLGLGLALVKGLVELHGGTVRAESGGVGQGATFTVRLPRVAALAEVEPVARRRHPPAARRRVLVVDDNRDGADTLAQVVELLGHEVTVAYDGTSAIELARANPPDVILCDIGLPGVSGYEVARALRTPEQRPELIALTGYALPEDVQRARQAGFTGHLAKPVDLAVIEKVLSRT